MQLTIRCAVLIFLMIAFSLFVTIHPILSDSAEAQAESENVPADGDCDLDLLRWTWASEVDYLCFFGAKVSHQVLDRIRTAALPILTIFALVTLWQKFKIWSLVSRILPFRIIGIANDNMEEPGGDKPSQELIRFHTFSVFVELIRWRDRTYEQPFEKKRVGMDGIEFDIEIYDEAIIYSYMSIKEPNENEIEHELEYTSSGIIEVATIPPGRSSLKRHGYRINGGGRATLTHYLEPGQQNIIVVRRIYNGFQSGQESIHMRMPSSSVDEMVLTVDFGLIDREFKAAPDSKYEGHTGLRADIQETGHSEDGKLWYAKYTNPEDNSRMIMEWRLN